ncbi:X-linked retinitis pigmentosa GTPase regulator-like isoform X2 [Sipha flava]|uniref:X-linked retinitis pigmentosa GTPase regulator-like isoform X2 n=1 Tax=Sipha flava TaxID=143950 RepID=A0A8B8G5E5_9HEMI|nr:X-linked retinitis pigmentosa GTPase regulator-like isoform X2 [Sipha flava]
MSEEDVIPDTGAVFTYGKSSFADNIPSHFFIRNDPIIEISCGNEHSGIVCKNGRVFCFGKNMFGQLGLGHTENVYKPNCVKNLKPDKVKHIACGRSHTIVSTDKNTVYGFGDNSEGQLGQPMIDVLNSYDPIRVTQFNDNIIQISAGSYHTAVLLENGDVYVWGSNNERQLGMDTINDSANIKIPTIVPINHPVVFISCGHNHTAFVTKVGDLFTCGDREYGKLGHDLWSLNKVDTTEKIVQVACGANHTVALNDAGKVFVCGKNDCGQIGLRSVTSQGHLYPCPITNERIVQINCGESHSAFITASGKLFMCGDGKYGKLCIDINQITIPMLVSKFVDKNLNVQMVSCGGNHTLVHAEPAENELIDNDNVKQMKSTDTLPPLKVAKKVIEERKENIEIFTTITPTANGNEQEALSVIKKNVKENNTDMNDMTDQQIQVDKKSYNDNTPIIGDKSFEKIEKITNNMLVNNSNEQKEKKVVNKSKYPRNERIRSRLCVFI